jgi:hypothetical protein
VSEDVKRRDLFRLTAGGLLVAGLGGAETPVFFSGEEFAAVDDLMEAIIPTDLHSPGARAAGCAAYVDRQLAESLDDAEKNAWRKGIQGLMALSKRKFGKPVAELTPDEHVTLLSQVAGNEANPETPEEKFFNTLKHATAFAYYSSEIGIHKEMEYKGNVYLPQFVGTEVK